MKKNMKKLVALVLTVAMVLSLGMTTAMAAINGQSDNGSITVRNATVAKDYDIYKVFDLTYSGDNVNYVYVSTGADDAFLEALQGDDSPFDLDQVGTTNQYNVAVKEGANGDVIDFVKDNIDSLGAPTASKTAESTQVVFDGLAYGYYYVTSTLGSEVTIDTAKPNVTINDKNQGPTWDTDPGDNPPGQEGKVGDGKVIVIDGVQYNQNTARFGDTVDFKVAVNATSYVDEELVNYYYVSDVLSDGFDPATDINCYILKAGTGDNAATGERVDLVSNGVVASDKVDVCSFAQNGNEMQLNVYFNELYGANAKIVMEYKAVVNDEAKIAQDGNPNTANFTYVTDDTFDPDNPSYDPTQPPHTDPTDPVNPPEIPNPDYDPDDPDSPPTIPNPDYDPDEPTVPGTPGTLDTPEDPYAPVENPDYDPDDPESPTEIPNPDTPYDSTNEVETRTYVMGLDINKFDGNSKAKLAGAKFELTDASGAKIGAIETAAGSGIYKYAATGGVTEFVTPAGGQIYVLGLDAGTYTIHETEAPAGYNLMTSDVSVTFKDVNGDDSALDDNGVYNYYTTDKDGEQVTASASQNAQTIDVPNYAGSELPETGGIGTTIFYALGAVLIVGAGILLVTKKRMGANG